MTYGFKFLNDSNETVIDDTNVKPWFYGQAPAMYTTDITNYSSFYQFNELNKLDGNGNPITNWVPEAGITSWKVYEIGYEVPVSYDCFILLNLPITSSKIFYSCEKPLSRIGNNRIILYAYVPNTAIATIADIPKAYIFVTNPIPNAIISTGYGIHIRNASAQYMFDSGKRHFQPKAFSQIYIKGLRNQYITNPGSYTTIETGLTGFATLGDAVIPTNAAWLLPSSDIIFGKWSNEEQAYKATHNVAVHKRSYTAGGINGLNVAQPVTFTSSSPTFSNTTGLFNNSYLIAAGQQQGFTDGSGVMLAIVADATPLDQGYTAPEFPQSFSLFRNVSNIIEGSGNGITITLTTTAVPNGTVVPYTITGISASDLTSSTLTGNFIVNNNTSNTFLTATNDGLSEGTETATLALNNGKASISFTISDSVSYSLSSFMTPEEGQSIAVTLTTTNLPNGSTVPYTITGISQADLSVGSLTGNFTISSNTSGLEFRFARDTPFEYETMRISVNNGATFLDIPITDVPAGNEVLTISPSTFTYNQSTTISITGGAPNTSFEFLSTPQGVDPVYAWNNRWLPQYASGAGIAYFDEDGNFYNPAPNGSDLGGSTTSTVNRTFWIFTTYTKNFRSFNYTINPEPSFFVSGTDNTQGPLYVNEGTTGFFKVTTANIPNGTVVYPKLIGGTLSANDFTNTGAGGITIQNNVATFQITFTADSFTDGATEYAELVVQYPNGTTKNSYGNIFVSDTSITPAGYSVTRSAANINEGAYIFFTIGLTAVPSGTQLWWDISGTGITANDVQYVYYDAQDGNGWFTPSGGSPLNNTFTVYGETVYQVILYIRNDLQTEGTETATFNLRTGYSGGTSVASTSFSINDTSTAPSYNESLTIVSDANGNYIVPLNGYMTISITGGAPNTGFTFAITNNGDPQPSSFPGVATLDGSGSFYNYITGATFQGSQTVGDKRLWVKFNYNNNVRSARANIVYDAGTTSGGEYCSGFTRYQNYNDGVGGVYAQVVATNSPLCGYVQQYTPTRTAVTYNYYNFDFQGDTWGLNGGRPGGAVTATIVTGPYAGFALSGSFNGSGQYRQVVGNYGALAVGFYTINFTFPGQDAYYSPSYRTIVAYFYVQDASASGGGEIP
jgi:hypothetical protein